MLLYHTVYMWILIKNRGDHVMKILSIILILFGLTPTNFLYAQEGDPSKGRSAGINIDINGNSYRSMNKIRSLINEAKYEEAARRSITFIKSEERGRRNGLEPGAYYLEAHNTLCVSAAALGKVEYAMEVCNASLELNPSHWESLKSRATLYYLTQDFENSLKDFQTALANVPEDNKAISDVLKQNISVVQGKLK